MMFVRLFFYWYEFLFLTLAAGTAPCIGQLLKWSAGRDILLGVALFGVVGIFAGAFELCHNRIFVLGLEKGDKYRCLSAKRLSHLACRPLKI